MKSVLYRKHWAVRSWKGVPLLCLFSSAASVFAASSTWTLNTSGSWASDANWSSGIPGSTLLANSPDIATFGSALTASGVITVDASRNISGILFSDNSSAYTLTGGPLLLSAGGMSQTLGGGTAHTDAIGHSSTLLLQGNYTFSADSTTTSRLLQIAPSGGVVQGTAATGNVSTLTLAGTNTGNNSIAGLVADGNSGGKIAISKTGTGSWTLSGANTFSGGVTVSAGVLKAGSSSTFASGAVASGPFGTGAVTFATGSTLASDGNLTLGASVFNLQGETVCQNLGRLVFAAPLNLGSAITTVRTLRQTRSQTASSWNGSTSGSSAISFSPQSGGPSVTVSNGTLRLVADASVPAGNFSVAEWGSVSFVSNAGLTIGNRVLTNLSFQPAFAAGAPRLTVEDGGYFNLGSGGVNRTANVFSLSGTSGAVVTALSASSTPGVLAINGTETTTYSGIIADGSAYAGTFTNASLGTLSGVMSVTKAGTGTQIFSGPSTFSGGVTVSAGTLRVGGNSTFAGGAVASGPLGRGPLTLANGVTFGCSSGVTCGASILNLQGDVLMQNSGRLVFGAPIDLGGTAGTTVRTLRQTRSQLPSSWTGGTSGNSALQISQQTNGPAITVSNGSLRLMADSTVPAANLSVVEIGAISFPANAGLVIGKQLFTNLTITPAFTGVAPRLTVEDGGYFNLGSGTSNRTANVFSLSGTSGAVITSISSGTTAGVLAINGTETATYAGVIADGSAYAATFTNASLGTLRGVLSVTKAGTGTQVFSGVNTYTGGTTVNGGTLVIASGGSLPATGSCTVNSGGVLQVDGTVSSAVTVNTGGKLSGTGLTGNAVATGTIQGGNGTPSGTLSTGSLTFNNGGTLAVSLGGNTSSAISASGAVVLGSSATDSISLQVNLTGAAITGTTYTLLTAPSVTYNGSLRYNGTTLANGSLFVVNNGVNAEQFSIAYTSTGITLTAVQPVVEPQTITFSGLPWSVVGTGDFSPGATVSSGRQPVYTSSNPSVATIVNNQIHIVGAGTTVITATEPGNPAYSAALPVSQTLTVYPVGLGSQTITFPGFYQKMIGDADFPLAATASSGLPVVYTSLDTRVATIVNNKVHLVAPGIAKIQADQSGGGSYYPAAPVVKYFTVVNDGSIHWTRTPENQLFQYSYSASFTWQTTPEKVANATITPVGYLWIPENCTQLRGLIIMQSNGPENMLAGHPVLRKAAADTQLGIIFFTPQTVYNFNTGIPYNASTIGQISASLVQSMQTIVDGLAAVSGYPEISTIPWLPMGESGSLLMVTGFVDGAPSRCIAAVCMQNPQLPALTRTVPMLMSKGTAYEWGQNTAPHDLLTSWKTDTQYTSVVNNRTAYPNWPLTMIQEPGTGHFYMSDKMVEFTSNYIRKICALRLPASGNTLNPINVTTGYLADPPLPYITDTTIYPYASSPAVNKSWFPDVETAQAAAAVTLTDWNAETQIPNIASGVNCTIGKYSFNGISQLTVNTASTFGITPILETAVPASFALSAGASLAQSPAGAYSEWLCGPMIPRGQGTFEVIMDRSYRASCYMAILADRTSNPSIRFSVQPIHTNLVANSGTVQTITFNPLSDVPAGTSSIPLSATSSSGLPVSFSVLSGPAVIRDNQLVFTQIPAGADFPVPVTVRAWQWGRYESPQIRTATPVERTFYLVKGTQSLTFSPPQTVAFASPDFDLGAKASSALDVAYSSDNPSVIAVTPDGKATVLATGAATLTASQNGDIHFDPAQPVIRQISVTYTPMQSWRLNKLSTPLPSGQAADNADPDGDGLSNLLEYALDSDPQLTEIPSGKLPESTLSDRLNFTFTRHRSDVTYIVEASSDMVNWTILETNPGTPGNQVTIQDPVGIDENTQKARFIRLRVAQP